MKKGQYRPRAGREGKSRELSDENDLVRGGLQANKVALEPKGLDIVFLSELLDMSVKVCLAYAIATAPVFIRHSACSAGLDHIQPFLVLNFAFGIGWFLPHCIGSKRLPMFLFVISVGSKKIPMPFSHRFRIYCLRGITIRLRS